MVTDYGFACGAQIQLNEAQLNKLLTGPAVTNLYNTAEGKSYYIKLGQKREVFDQASLVALGLNGAANTLADRSISYLPYGVPVIRDGVAIKGDNSATVYYVNKGTKHAIPSWLDLVNLHVTPFAISTTTDTLLNDLPTGPMAYSPGRLVKSPSSPTVYIVKDDSTLFPISSFTYPQEIGLTMSLLGISDSDLRTYSAPSLLQTKLRCGTKNFVGILGSVHEISDVQLTTFGFSASDFIDAGNICSNLTIGSALTGNYIRVSNGTIFYVDLGQKHPIIGYSTYLAHGGNSQNTAYVSDYFASLIMTGSALSQ